MGEKIELRVYLSRVLGQAFPWMAIGGLLLAAWGLVFPPNELRSTHEVARMIFPAAR